MTLVILVGCSVLLRIFKGINKWDALVDDYSDDADFKLKEIRKKCFNTPYIVYI